jgi:hypothetical protein
MSRKLLHYLLLSAAISWSMAGVIAFTPLQMDSLLGTFLLGGGYMWGPALAVLILQRLVYKQPLRPYGWQFERLRWPWLLGNLFTPLIVVLVTLGMIFLLGNLLGIDGFGHVDLSKEGMLLRMQELVQQAGQDPASLDQTGNLFTNLPLPGWVLLLVMMVLAIIPGATINLVFAFGEELGWRGLMLAETKSLGYWRSALVIGVAWGLWHAPLILMGHNYPESPLLGVGMMVLFCIATSLVMNLLAMRSGTIVGAAAYHGVTNAIAGSVLIFVHDAHSLLGGPAGLAGIIATLLVATVLLSRFRPYVADWASQSYDPAEEPEGHETS